MKDPKRIIYTIAFVGMLIVGNLIGSEAFAQRSGGKHQGPPPEAYTACEGKIAGDAAEFESPRGDTVKGTCEERDGRLVLHPDNPPSRGRGMNRTSD